MFLLRVMKRFQTLIEIEGNNTRRACVCTLNANHNNRFAFVGGAHEAGSARMKVKFELRLDSAAGCSVMPVGK